MKELSFEYDAERDVLTVEGVKYAGQVFRQIGDVLPIGRCFRLVARENGTVVLEQVDL